MAFASYFYYYNAVLAPGSRGLMSLARGTKTWVKDPVPWELEYMMFCLGNGFVAAGACEFYYRLGKAHKDFDAIVLRSKTNPNKSQIYG